MTQAGEETLDQAFLEDLHYLQENVAQLNQSWSIEEARLSSDVPVLGGMIVFVKRCIRKAISWFVRPYWEQQVAFNGAVARAVSDIYRIQSRMLQGAEEPPAALPGLPESGGARVIQLVSSLNFGDAVGNDVIEIKRRLQEAGYATEIFANSIHPKIPAGTARHFREIPPLRREDLVIYHFASECPLAEYVKRLPCRKILRYHNITPPEFFHGYDGDAERATAVGLAQVKALAPYMDACIPASEFSKRDLREMGYTCPIEVLPVLVRFSDYAQPPSEEVLRKYADDRVNVLFVGRMAPNKKVEDVISCFWQYQTRYNRKSRLILAGSFSEKSRYVQMLQRHAKQLGAQEVVFTGHIPFAELLAYYRTADLFLCMSEHEGFCVPLLEAMYFHVPVLAYASTAVPETLGEAGVVVAQKDYAAIAGKMDALIRDPVCREAVLRKEEERLRDFDEARIAEALCNFLEPYLEAGERDADGGCAGSAAGRDEVCGPC